MKKAFLPTIVSVFMLLAFSQCEESDNMITTAVKVDFRLTDAPVDFEEVNIDIIGLRYHNDTEGWVDVEDFNPGIFDLLKLRNGVDTLIGSAEILSGHITQIRLMLGTENSVVIDGEKKPLFTPSAQQSGVKILVNKTFEPGSSQEILLDFDAARSIESNPNKFLLKPVIRIIEHDATGAVQGRILPLGVASVVYLQNATDTLSTYPEDNGKFLIRGVHPGTYELRVVPESPYSEVTMKDIPVIEKVTIDVGTITLSEDEG